MSSPLSSQAMACFSRCLRAWLSARFKREFLRRTDLHITPVRHDRSAHAHGCARSEPRDVKLAAAFPFINKESVDAGPVGSPPKPLHPCSVNPLWETTAKSVRSSISDSLADCCSALVATACTVLRSRFVL